jgi:hypothetical protein
VYLLECRDDQMSPCILSLCMSDPNVFNLPGVASFARSDGCLYCLHACVLAFRRGELLRCQALLVRCQVRHRPGLLGRSTSRATW